MGLMDKFKNLFTDEEIIEEDDGETIEIKEVKKEEEVQKLPTFMREKIEKEKEKEIEKRTIPDLEIKKEIKLEPVLEKIEVDLPKSPKLEEKKSFKFPLDLEENDFIERRSRQSIHRPKTEEVVKKPEIERSPVRKESPSTGGHVKAEQPRVADLYKDKKTEVKKQEKDKKFRATPIISPIYGVLDKNYTPDDMKNANGDNLEERRHSKNVDFDSVRKKAYGTLSEEIKENLMCENCEYLKEAKECKERYEKTSKKYADDSYTKETYAKKSCIKESYSDGLVYDVLEDNRRDITLDEATENYYDYGVEYEKQGNYNSYYETPAYDTSLYKKRDYEESVYEEPVSVIDEVKIVHHDEEVRQKKEIPPVKSSINLLSTLKKSMGDPVDEPKVEKNLELTDDLFNLIDSMYDERNETK